MCSAFGSENVVSMIRGISEGPRATRALGPEIYDKIKSLVSSAESNFAHSLYRPVKKVRKKLISSRPLPFLSVSLIISSAVKTDPWTSQNIIAGNFIKGRLFEKLKLIWRLRYFGKCARKMRFYWDILHIKRPICRWQTRFRYENKSPLQLIRWIKVGKLTFPAKA